jgi:hypothetical protein
MLANGHTFLDRFLCVISRTRFKRRKKKKLVYKVVGRQQSQPASVVVVVDGYLDTLCSEKGQRRCDVSAVLTSLTNTTQKISNSLHLLSLPDFCPRPNLHNITNSLTSPFFPSLAIPRHSPFGYQHPHREPDQWRRHGHG